MTDVSIFERLTPLLRDVFDDDDIVATPELTAQKVGGWDSLGNVRLFLEIEKEFSVRFSATEIISLKNVGQLVDLIEKKTHRSVTAIGQSPHR
jgi:acyl carrier protein